MLMVKIYDKGDCDENSCDQPGSTSTKIAVFEKET